MEELGLGLAAGNEQLVILEGKHEIKTKVVSILTCEPEGQSNL